ncbi:hypothetical protein T06_8989 [Trichinella sp. T6]|nr:hypothetical protein T06_8989 [Trichinella sp. T6]
MSYCFKRDVTKLQTIKIKIDKVHRKQNPLGCAAPQQFIKGMLLSQLFNCEFVNRFRYVIRMATAIQWIAMVVAMLYLFVQYRKSKNTVWRRRRAIRHHQVLKDIGCFEWVPLRLYSKVPSAEYLCGRNGQQMAFKKIFAVRRDPPLNRIMEQMKPVKISRENRIVPPKEVKLMKQRKSENADDTNQITDGTMQNKRRQEEVDVMSCVLAL